MSSQVSTGLQLSTTAFNPQGNIPKQFTCDGADISPDLSWGEPPKGTRALVLIADDPDAPVGLWTHWLIYDLPAEKRQLQQGFPKDRDLADGGRQGQNDFRKIGYNGPCPPPGKPHRYYFKLFALEAPLGLKAGATRKEVDAAMKQARVLAQTEVMGKYGR
ncbi:MAG TPA: YbhB/YbcL family Raf kinase inhibitor-like protein [Terriglobales bacterium]|nr:YbhB/YbcL family Raf kinase inhibitor-like protein [Terriglobales bacterium]